MRLPHYPTAAVLCPSRSTLVAFVSLIFPGGAAFAAAAGNADHGKALFQQTCALCHVGGEFTAGGQGPTLDGVVGRKAGATGFSYTPALKNSNLTWDAASLDRFLTNPTAVVPGT